MSWFFYLRYQEIDDYSVMLARAFASVIFFYFLFCLSLTLTYAVLLCGVSVRRLQAEELFFLFPLWLFFYVTLS